MRSSQDLVNAFRARRLIVTLAVLALVAGLAPGVPSTVAAEPTETAGPPISAAPPAAPPAEQGPDRPVLSERSEVESMRSQRSRTYALPSGQFEAEVFPGSIHFDDGSGTWAPIDTTLVETSDGGLTQRANSIDLDLPPDLTMPVRLGRGDDAISFALVGASQGSRASTGATARYADALEGVDVVYEAHPDGVKESLVLEGPGSPAAVSFDIAVPSGVSLVPDDDGSVRGERHDGTTAFEISPPFTVDADQQVGAASMTVEATEDGSRLTLSADENWLADAERAWPVVIDPSVILGDGAGETIDCHISASVSGACSNTRLFFGKGSLGGGYSRALAQFADVTTAVPRDAVVSDAHFQMYLDSTQEVSPSRDVSMHAVTSAWDGNANWTARTSAANWTTTGGDFDSTAEWTTDNVLATGWYHWYANELVQSWVHGTSDNHGVLFKTQEDATVQVLRFTSEDSATSSRWPRLTISYGYEWGTTDWFTTFDQTLTERSGLSVNVANGNLRLHARDMTIDGLGPDLDVSRSWNSRWPYDGDLGAGWKLHAGAAVNLIIDPSGVGMNGPNGHVPQFYPDGTGGFISAPDVNGTLVETAAGEYTYTDHVSGDEIDFEQPAGGCGVAVSPCAVLIAERDRDGHELTYAYTGSYQTGYGYPYLSTITDARGRVVDFTNSTYLTHADDPTTRQVRWFYTSGKMTTFRDGNGQDTAYTWDGSNRITRVADPHNRRTDFTYDGDGRVLTIKRILDNTTGVGPTWTFAYGSWTCAANQCTADNTITDPNGGVTTYTVDSTGHALIVEDALNGTTETSYTDSNDVDTVTDQFSGVSSVTYNADTMPITATEPPSDSGQTPETALASYGDTVNNPYLATSSVDAEGDCTRTEYDAEGHVTDVHEGLTPSGSPLNCDSGTDADRWEYTHNADGQITTATDPENNVTTYTYDTDASDLGELVLIEHPDDAGYAGVELGDEAYTYDTLSRPATYTDGKGQVTAFTYDGLDRVTRVTFNGDASCASYATCVDLVYDDAGNVTSRVDGTGTTTWTYDRSNRVTSETLPYGVNACTTGGTAMTYTYDGAGNLTSHCDGAGVVSYGYDAGGRNCWVYIGTPGGSPTCASPPTGAVNFDYDAAGRRIETVFPTSPVVTETVTYDDAGNLTEVRAVRADTPTPTELTDIDYSYTQSGSSTVDRALRYTMTDTANVTTSYGYDDLHRLTSADLPGTSSDQSYTFDGNGNRTSKTVGATTTNYTYNDANQLISGPTTPTYDDNGNETTGPDGRASTFTAMDQTASITPSGGSPFNMTYAGSFSGERRTAGARNFANSLSGVSRDAKSGDPTVYYVRDQGGNVVARQTSTTTHFYLTDGGGSIIKLIDTAGAVTNEYSYDAWGVTTVISAGVYNPWQFAGGFRDADTGLTKFGTRYYDAAVGRWTQRDPSGTDDHYVYASNDPVNYFDPSGLAATSRTNCGWLNCTNYRSVARTKKMHNDMGSLGGRASVYALAALLCSGLPIAGTIVCGVAAGLGWDYVRDKVGAAVRRKGCFYIRYGASGVSIGSVAASNKYCIG